MLYTVEGMRVEGMHATTWQKDEGESPRSFALLFEESWKRKFVNVSSKKQLIYSDLPQNGTICLSCLMSVCDILALYRTEYTGILVTLRMSVCSTTPSTVYTTY